MRRRDFIALLGGGAAWPVVARAQQSTKIPRVGILSPANNEAAATLAAFRKGIHDLGYVEGQTIILDFRLSKGTSMLCRRLPLNWFASRLMLS
jgi:putative tryptophan/tyrosine transport system substrate-binding protein